MKRIYLLHRTDRSGPQYDSFWSFAIVARTPHEAREYAAKQAADEGEEVWTDPARSTITLIGIANKSTALGIAVSDFNAG